MKCSGSLPLVADGVQQFANQIGRTGILLIASECLLFSLPFQIFLKMTGEQIAVGCTAFANRIWPMPIAGLPCLEPNCYQDR